jgi:hypothetical protein
VDFDGLVVMDNLRVRVDQRASRVEEEVRALGLRGNHRWSDYPTDDQREETSPTRANTVPCPTMRSTNPPARPIRSPMTR